MFFSTDYYFYNFFQIPAAAHYFDALEKERAYLGKDVAMYNVDE